MSEKGFEEYHCQNDKMRKAPRTEGLKLHRSCNNAPTCRPETVSGECVCVHSGFAAPIVKHQQRFRAQGRVADASWSLWPLSIINWNNKGLNHQNQDRKATGATFIASETKLRSRRG